MKILSYTFWVILLLAALPTGAQEVTLPKIYNYTKSDYGAHAQNFAIKQDHRGVLYFANVNGLLEYDGKNWRNYQPAKNSFVFSLDIDSDNRLFAGGLTEFGSFSVSKNGLLQYDSLSSSLPDSVQDFTNVWNTVVHNKRVWFNAGKYLFEYDYDQIVTHHPPGEIERIFVVDSQIWVSVLNKGLYLFDEGDFTPIPNGSFFSENHVMGIVVWKDNRYLVGTRQDGIYLFSPGNDYMIVPFAADYKTELSKANIYGACELDNGTFAFNTLQSGVYIFDDQQQLKAHISREQGLQNETVIGMHQDRHGQLWCALDNGISMIGLNTPLSYAFEGEQFLGAILDVMVQNEHVYVGTMQGLYKGHKKEHGLKRVPGIPGVCYDVAHFKDSLTLVGSTFLYETDGASTRLINKIHSKVISNLTTHPNILMAGGVDGIKVLKYNSGNWEELLEISDLPDEVYYIEQIGDQLEFWIGTFSRGVHRLILSDDFANYDLIRYNSQINSMPEGQIHVLKYRNKVYFSAKNQIYRFNNETNKFKPAKEGFGLPVKSVFRLRERAGHLWALTHNRIYHKHENNLDSSSFKGIDIGGITAIEPEPDGSCWFGGDDALVYFNGNWKPKNQRPFSCNIRLVELGDSTIFYGAYLKNGLPAFEQPKSDQPTFKYQNNAISFRYATSYYQHQDSIKYSYKLEGYHDKFTPWRRETKASFTNLPEGTYTFKVKARNIYGEESKIASYTFTILPPWYRTWWAYLLYTLAGLFVLILVVRLYAFRLKREKGRLEELVQQRTRQLDEKNQHLQTANLELNSQKVLLEDKNKDILDSINYAEKIQSSIFTSDIHFENTFREHFQLYLPKDILSGDFYWAHRIQTEKENKIIWTAADCTGHGVPGAMLSIIGYNGMNKVVKEYGATQPSEILNNLREVVLDTFAKGKGKDEMKDGMDIGLCSLDFNTNELQYAGANIPLWILSDGDFKEIKPDRQPIGKYARKEPFTNHSIQLSKGAFIYLSSDGYADQFGGERGKKFKSGKFKKLLLEHRHENMEQQKQTLEKAFEDWKGSLEQIDDVCVIGVRV